MPVSNTQNTRVQAPQTASISSSPRQTEVQNKIVEVKRTTAPLKRRRKSKLSISSHLEEKESDDKKVVIDYSNMPKDSFTYEQMLKHWNDYADMLNKQGEQLLYLAMKREKPVLQDNTIICSLLNNSLVARFEAENVKLLQFIREKLNNFSINIDTPVTKLEEVKQVYTSRDRYDFMLEKNPLLKDFVVKLKLDLA